MRGIYNNNRVTKNLSVYLSLPGITILRKKNPELLSVTYEDKTYEDKDVAQSIIDNMFGHRELWRACSYIEQKSRCSLLSGSGIERMELLNALSFTGENPKEYINKISTILKEKTLEFEKNQAVFIQELNCYTESLKNKTIKFLYKEEDIKKIEYNIDHFKEEEKRYHELLLQQERLQGTLSFLIKHGEELRDKLKNLESIKIEISLPQLEDIVIPQEFYNKIETPAIDSFEIISFDNYKKEKNIISKEIQNQQQKIAKRDNDIRELEEIERELKNCKEINYIDVTQEMIWQTEKNEKERERHLQESSVLGLEYSEEVLRNTLARLTEQLKNYTLLESQIENYNKLISIENKIQTYANIGEIKDLEELSKKQLALINDLKKGLELLSCPKCSASLRYRSGVLSLEERNPVSLSEIQAAEKDYNLIMLKIDKTKEYLKLEDNRTFLIKSIDKDTVKHYIENLRNKFTGLSSLINRISQIRIIKENEIQSFQLAEIYKYQTLLKRKNKIRIEEIDTIDLDKLQNLENKYRAEQDRVAKNQELMKNYQKIESERLSKISYYENKKKEIDKKNTEKIKRYEFQIKEKENNEKSILQIKENILENDNKIKDIKIDQTILEKFHAVKKSLEEVIYKLSDAQFT